MLTIGSIFRDSGRWLRHPDLTSNLRLDGEDASSSMLRPGLEQVIMDGRTNTAFARSKYSPSIPHLETRTIRSEMITNIRLPFPFLATFCSHQLPIRSRRGFFDGIFRGIRDMFSRGMNREEARLYHRQVYGGLVSGSPLHTHFSPLKSVARTACRIRYRYPSTSLRLNN